MAADFENLSIRISASAKDAIKKVNLLAEALEGLNAQLAAIDPSNMSRAASIAQEFGSAIKGMGSKRATKDIEAIANGMAQVTQSASGVAQVANAQEQLAEATEHVAQASQEAGQSAGGGGGSAADGMKNLAEASKKAENVIKTLSAGWSGFTGTLKKAGSIFGNVAKKTFSSAMGMKKISNGMNVAKNSAAKFVKELTRIGKMLKLMVTRMVLRQIISGIGDGFKNLAQYSSKVNASISLLWNSFRQLGNSIAAAVSPLLNALAPALNYIIQLAVRAANAINQLISALLGLGTWTKAKTLTDSYADSLKKAGGAAKELKKTVLGFDELNQLQDNKSSGGGATDPSDMFEETGISDLWKKWAEKLKEMWAKADFTELGTVIGKKLLDALNKIPWEEIKQTANKIGKSIATLINGFIEVEGLGRKIGETLAQAINTGFEFANSFVHNLHWQSLGAFIAESFNGFFETIDWPLIKDTVLTGLNGIYQAFRVFIATFNWDNISDFVSNGINTIAAAINEIFNHPLDLKDKGFSTSIENYEPRPDVFTELARKVGDQLNKAVENIDWELVGRAIGGVIQSAMDFCATLLETLDWSQIKGAIQDLLKGFFESVDENQLGAVIGTVLGAAILSGIGKIGIAVAKIAFVEKLKALFATSEVAKGAAAASGLGTFFLAISEFAAGALLVFSSFKSQVEDGIGFLNTEFSFMGNVLLTTFTRINPAVATILQALTSIIVRHKDEIIKKFAGLWDKITGDANSFGGKIKRIFIDLFNIAKSYLTSNLTDLWESFKKFGVDVWSVFTDLWDQISKFFDPKNWTFSGVADGLKETFDSAKSAVKGIWNSISDSLNGTYTIGSKSFSINLPKLYATGGFPEDGLFMANHNELVGRFSNGKTAVANNEQITNGIAQAVYSAITAANSGSSGQYINNTIMVDGVAIARAVTKGQERLDRRYSPTMA